MNIAIETSNLARREPTGVAAYGTNLIRQIARLDKQNQYYLCYRFSRLKYRRHFFRVDQPNFHLKIFQEPFPPRFLKHVDLYHGLDARLCGWKRVKKVVTIHDTLQVTNEFGVTRHPEKKARRYRALMSSADRIIADSEHTKQDILQHFPVSAEKIDVVHLGVEDRYRPQAPEETKRVLVKYGIRFPYLFYVGCIETRKNLIRMLEAFSRIRTLPEVSGVRVVLAGKQGSGGEEVFRAVDKLHLQEHVHPVGYVDREDLPCLYSGATIFLFPSLYEGFGLPVLEAMACGCPVVCSRTTSLPEVAGDAALLVDPEDTERIAEAMRGLLSDAALRQEYARRGPARAALFPWERTARNTLEVYRKTLQDG
jgi:glycosyltransferase involved in cell wall biosynthesis